MITLDDIARLPHSPERNELMRREFDRHYAKISTWRDHAAILSEATRMAGHAILVHIPPDPWWRIAQRRAELDEALKDAKKSGTRG